MPAKGIEADFIHEANLFKITVDELEQRYLNDILITAVENGTGYWAAVKDYRFSDNYVFVDFMKQDDYPNGRWHRLRGDMPGWKAAAKKAALHFGKSLHAFMIDHDAEYADVTVQLWMFGEVRYG